MDIFEVVKQSDEETLNVFFSAIKESEENRYVVNSKNSDKYTPLHVAIFARNWKAVELLIENDADINAKCYGTPPAILALQAATVADGKEFGLNVFQRIIQHPHVNPFAKDDNGYTPLHFAAKFNLIEAISELFKVAEASDLVNSMARSGATPAHFATMTDAVESLELLLDNGATLKKKLHFTGSSVLHTAAHYNAQRCLHLLLQRGLGSLQDKDNNGQTVEYILQSNNYPIPNLDHPIPSHSSVQALTGIYSSSYCFNHHTCSDAAFDNADQPPENVHRLEVLLNPSNGILYSHEFIGRVVYELENSLAPISDILRVHEWSYVKKVADICNELSEDYNDEDGDGIGKLDGDTTISHGTYKAALAAVGTVCNAIDNVMKRNLRNVFCPIRPPGHHAGPRGAIAEAGSQSHGFCIFNNISLAGSYVMNRYRDTVKKIVIVDFDVHHGNGTEETVKWLKPGVTKENVSSELVSMTLQAPRYKPWFSEHDTENVLFISVHGYGPRARGYEHLFPLAAFYPGSGPTKIPEIPLTVASTISEESAVSSLDPLILDIGVPLPKQPYHNQPIQTKDSKYLEELEERIHWRNYFREVIFPRIYQFQPDFMLISAGFDAHKKDSINAGYISIIEEDFAWITDHLSYIANSCCHGRIVSALEGGYQLGGEFSSAFAKSVQSHVHSLVRASTSNRRYDEEYNQKEQENEERYLEKLRLIQEKEIEKEKERIFRQQQLLRQQQQELAMMEQATEAEVPVTSEEIASEQMEVVTSNTEVVKTEQPVSVSAPSNSGTEEDMGGRKRRRPAVDYVALDQELRKAKEAKEEGNGNSSSQA